MSKTVKLTIDSVVYDVSSSVIADSVKISYSLFNNLEPTTNKADFQLAGNASAIPLILATTSDITAQILDGATVLFTGYLTDSYSLLTKKTGKQPITLSVEDPGIKKLKKCWVSSNELYTLFTNNKICDPANTANSIIHKIATLAGVTVSSSIPTISNITSFNIQDKDNKTYWDVLKELTYEFGYVFYFNEQGQFNLYKIAIQSVTPTASFATNTNIIGETDNKSIEIKKSLIQYKKIALTWDEWETKSNIYVFSDSTGGDDNHPCNIPVAAGAYYPTGADASTFVYQEYKAETGQKIINVNSATPKIITDSGFTVEFENLGTRGKLRIRNTSAVEADIRKLKILANEVILVKSQNTTNAGESLSASPVLKYTAKHIHDTTAATNFANTLKYYYKYGNFSYNFKSKTDCALGSIVTLNDAMYLGLSEPVVIQAKVVRDNGIIEYTAIGVDLFNLSDSIIRDITVQSDNKLAQVSIPEITNPSITIGTTEVSLGGTVSTISGVSVSGSEFNYDKQRVYAHFIPGSNYQILTQQNKGTLLSDVFTIYELLAPYTPLTETTYSMHNVVNGWDDWVRDVSFHNYGSKMKSVDVISHFTGTTAGDWQWVSRYSTGTDYDMIERYLMTIEGDTGNVKIGEDNTLVSAARGKLDIRSKGWITQPSAIISIDSSNGDQPQSALQVQNGYNFAYGGNLTTLKLLNSSDTGTVLKLENAGTGNYLAVDNKLYIDNDGSVKTKGSYGFLTGSALDPELVLYKGGTGFLNLRRYGEDYTILNVWAPPSWAGSREATLVLQRGDEPNVEYIDIYNNGYDSETQYGMRIQKRGTGEYRPFVFDYYDGITKNKIYEITPDRKISNNYASGSLGTGWALDYNSSVPNKSYLEVDNLLVRDTIRTHIFQKDVIKATNGQLYVSDSGVIAKTYDGTEPYVVHFDVDKSATFSVNDEIVVKDVNLSGGTVTATTRFKIDSIGTVANGIQPYTVSVIEGTLWNLQTGMTAVRTSGGSVLIDASTTYRPFIDVLNNGVTKARLGNLDGISGCSGYGLYSDNVYLTGYINATSGNFSGTLAADIVTADNIKAGAITATKIAAGAITADKISAGTITADKLDLNSLFTNSVTVTTSAGNNVIYNSYYDDNLQYSAGSSSSSYTLVPFKFTSTSSTSYSPNIILNWSGKVRVKIRCHCANTDVYGSVKINVSNRVDSSSTDYEITNINDIGYNYYYRDVDINPLSKIVIYYKAAAANQVFTADIIQICTAENIGIMAGLVNTKLITI